ncbi:uncharacterized protein [Dermacentor andersoni]|uniref:uncharacterized protein n=1 Tax=Dermacentor andersoni TaxID=34620 RepID=UPI002155A894|nr:uncharacterized protein LOC126548478 [Dermacentor andersoni]
MSRVSVSDALSPSTEDADYATKELEAELQRLAVNDEAVSQSNEAIRDVVTGIVDKVNELLASPAVFGGTEDGGPNADRLLSYLKAEKSYCANVRKQTKVIPPPLQIRDATEKLTTSEEDSEMQRRVAAVLDKDIEFRACSQERQCAELVGLLTDNRESVEAAKPWSASEPGSTERPTELDRILFNAACSALPRLIETSAREWLSKVDEEEDHDETLHASAVAATASLPEELALYARLAAVLDVEQARCSSDILDLRAEFRKRAALVRNLLAQRERLRRVRASCEQRESLVGDVTRSVSDVRDHLASRVKLCESLMAVADAQSRREDAAVCPDAEPVADHGATIDERCARMTEGAATKVDAVEELQRKRASMRGLVDTLDADLNDACQGSVETWLEGMKAKSQRDEKQDMMRALFIEFHTMPERFLRRMKSMVTADVATHKSYKNLGASCEVSTKQA